MISDKPIVDLSVKRFPDGGMPFACPMCGAKRIFSTRPGALIGVFYHNTKCHGRESFRAGFPLTDSDTLSPEDYNTAIEEAFDVEEWDQDDQ